MVFVACSLFTSHAARLLLTRLLLLHSPPCLFFCFTHQGCAEGYGSFVTGTELKTPLPTTAPGCKEVGSNGCTCSLCPDYFFAPLSKPIGEAQCYFMVTLAGLVVAEAPACNDSITTSIANATVAFLRTGPQAEVTPQSEGGGAQSPSAANGTIVARADCLEFSVSVANTSRSPEKVGCVHRCIVGYSGDTTTNTASVSAVCCAALCRTVCTTHSPPP